MYPKHQLFYMMGGAYGVLFTIMGLMLMHPTIGLPNTKADPSRWLGWVSYVTIEVMLLVLLLLSAASLIAVLVTTKSAFIHCYFPTQWFLAVSTILILHIPPLIEPKYYHSLLPSLLHLTPLLLTLLLLSVIRFDGRAVLLGTG